MTALALRQLPVPSSEPPFDDEHSSGGPGVPPVGSVQGTLALAFVLPSGLPALPAPPPGLRLVPEPGAANEPAAAAVLDLVDFGPQPTPSDALPDPRSWAGPLAQAMVEVLAGDRPVSQLVRWTSGEVYDDIAARVCGPGPGEGLVPRAVIRSVHLSEPADGVAEVAALVRRGVRTTAMALRLEGLDGRWQCTAVELG